MHLWHDISVGDNVPKTLTAIIEVPRGSNNKYEINKENGLISLDRVLYGANFYPFDYGFAPQTLWEDGDALDIILITTNPLFPGCVVEARPIGIVHMIDSGEGDDKVVCVPAKDPRFEHYTDIKDLGEHRLKEIKHLFETMKILQNKKVEVTGFGGVKEAHAAVKKGIQLYQEKFGKK